MDILKAQEVELTLNELKEVRKQREIFKKTKEFCEVDFRGQDNLELKHSLKISYRTSPLIVEKIRELVKEALQKEEERILKKLDEL